jgi:hypothetical protein
MGPQGEKVPLGNRNEQGLLNLQVPYLLLVILLILFI